MHINDEKGSLIILISAGMTLFLVLLGFVTDIGFLYVQRAILSNTVDAAALAGVQELPTSPSYAYERALEYGLANRAEIGELAVNVSGSRERITVEARRDVELFFLRIFGRDSAPVSAKAVAEVGMVSGYRGVVPFGVVQDDFQYGQSYYLKYGPGIEEAPYHGNFGALALGGTGANNYRDNIRNGYQGLLRVGDTIQTETGNMAGPTNQGVADRINASPNCHWLDRHINCSRIVVVPVIDTLDVTGRSYVTIVGFASFYLEDTSITQSDSYVVGRFIEMSVDGEIGEGGDFGLKVFRLVR